MWNQMNDDDDDSADGWEEFELTPSDGELMSSALGNAFFSGLSFDEVYESLKVAGAIDTMPEDSPVAENFDVAISSLIELKQLVKRHGAQRHEKDQPSPPEAPQPDC